jgi:hypothetical protein
MWMCFWFLSRPQLFLNVLRMVWTKKGIQPDGVVMVFVFNVCLIFDAGPSNGEKLMFCPG